MGYPKARLPFGPELMLPRVVRIVRQVVAPIVVVAARDQDLPALPSDVIVVYDQRDARGPLEGLFAGLSHLPSDVHAAYATSCDVPLISSEFIRYLLDQLGDHDLVVPVEDQFAHPLAAVYRTSLIAPIAELLATDQLRPAFLFTRVRCRRVPVDELRRIDPELRALRNLNHRSDYEAALRECGFTAPPEILGKLS